MTHLSMYLNRDLLSISLRNSTPVPTLDAIFNSDNTTSHLTRYAHRSLKRLTGPLKTTDLNYHHTRQSEILRYIESNNLTERPFLVVDDDESTFQMTPHCVPCDSQYGLTMELALSAIAKL